MQASAGNAENIRDDLNGLDKAVSAVLGLRTIERNQLLVSIAKSKFAKHPDDKNEKITKPEELVRLYDLLIQVTFFISCPTGVCTSADVKTFYVVEYHGPN
jgi:signal recognition particle subunit SRP68